MLIALRFVEQQKEKPMPHTKKYGSGFSCKDFSKQNKNWQKEQICCATGRAPPARHTTALAL